MIADETDRERNHPNAPQQSVSVGTRGYGNEVGG